ncbi:MAG: SGNH/GDSL hydrolase family protein [Lentisphaeria bacterium]
MKRERHLGIPLFHEGKWLSGAQFKQLEAMECAISYALLPGSVRIEDAGGSAFQNGADYYFDAIWGAFGRMPGSAIGEDDAVFATYEYCPQRIDSIIADALGHCYLKEGIVNGATPFPPELGPGEALIGNVYFDRFRSRLSEDMLFPFVKEYSTAAECPSAAGNRLPRVMAKLRAGQPLKVLTWGDSVTACDFIPDESRRWTNIFVEELRRRFPASEITLVNLGWPGKAVNTFQCEPPGSAYNYEEKVVHSGADLVTLEFVNDAYLTMAAEFNRIYDRVAIDFKRMGMEPIVILPHPVRPDWMDLRSQKEVVEDPRPYVKFLRQWAIGNDFAIADVSARFLHLWQEAIPYNSLMLNNINHPDARGIKLYAEVVSAVFPEN